MRHLSKWFVVPIAALVTLGGCSTVDRVGSGDYGLYSGRRASMNARNSNPIDTGFSAIGDNRSRGDAAQRHPKGRYA